MKLTKEETIATKEVRDDRADEQKERDRIVAAGEKVRRRLLKMLWKLRKETEN
jgi:hypothetical protein